MKFYKHLKLLGLLLFINHTNLAAQTTPEELGQIILTAFQRDSISQFAKLVPTIAEMKQLANQIGINKDSLQFKKVLEGFPAQLAEFHENINLIYSDTTDNGLHWQNTKLEKITKRVDSMHLDNSNPNSKVVPITSMKIYFSSGTSRFVLILSDIFQVSILWKIGNNITLKKLN